MNTLTISSNTIRHLFNRRDERRHGLHVEFIYSIRLRFHLLHLEGGQWNYLYRLGWNKHRRSRKNIEYLEKTSKILKKHRRSWKNTEYLEKTSKISLLKHSENRSTEVLLKQKLNVEVFAVRSSCKLMELANLLKCECESYRLPWVIFFLNSSIHHLYRMVYSACMPCRFIWKTWHSSKVFSLSIITVIERIVPMFSEYSAKFVRIYDSKRIIEMIIHLVRQAHAHKEMKNIRKTSKGTTWAAATKCLTFCMFENYRDVSARQNVASCWWQTAQTCTRKMWCQLYRSIQSPL